MGTIEKNSEGLLANIFFEGLEPDLGYYPLVFDAGATILACGCSDPLELELVDGNIEVGYWDQWYYYIYPGILDFGAVEIGQGKSLSVFIERVAGNIKSEHGFFLG